IIVLDSPLALLLRKRDVEVIVKVTAVRRRPGKGPAHPLLVGLQLYKWCPRYRPEHNAMVFEVDDRTIEAIRYRRAGWTASLVVRAKHEVIDEKLRAPPKEVSQRDAAFIGFELVLLVDSDPRQLLPLPGKLIAAPC